MGKLFTRHCDWFHLKAVTQSTQRTCILVHSSINWHSKYLPDLGGYLYGWFKVTSASSTAAFCRLNDVPIWKKIDFSTTKNYFFCTQIAHEQQSSQSIETIDFSSARVFYYRTICYSFSVFTAKWNVLLIYTNFHLTFPTYTLPSCICVLVCVWIRMCVHIQCKRYILLHGCQL